MVARILSRSSTVEESEDEESLVRREDVERTLNQRRILMLLAIVLGFLVVASILLFCVAYEIKRQEEFKLLEEIVCAANDVACIGKRCPKWMTWKPEENQCVEEGQARMGHLGVVTNHVAYCDIGFVWVERKGKRECMRIPRAG